MSIPSAVLLALAIVFPTQLLARSLEGVPEHGPNPAAFAPAGWAVESTLTADLNGDLHADQVVVLLDQSSGSRALLWLHGDERGFKRIATNRGLLACLGCLGVKGGDGTPTFSVKKRVVSVEQFGGSRSYYGATHRFRFDGSKVVLIGVDEINGDSMTEEQSSTSTNLITGVTILHLKPAVLDDDDKPTKAKPSTTRTTSKPKPLPSFEEVGWRED